jgi:hypothetical protein
VFRVNTGRRTIRRLICTGSHTFIDNVVAATVTCVRQRIRMQAVVIFAVIDQQGSSTATSHLNSYKSFGEFICCRQRTRPWGSERKRRFCSAAASERRVTKPNVSRPARTEYPGQFALFDLLWGTAPNFYKEVGPNGRTTATPRDLASRKHTCDSPHKNQPLHAIARWKVIAHHVIVYSRHPVR